MIIIGYQGIGKSTLASASWMYIDLESSLWRVDGVRSDTWYKEYCNVAEGLSKQGYIVFVSSHKEVRDRLKDSKQRVCVCYPAVELRDEWIDKLETRFFETRLDKDYRALGNAKDRYQENILELKNSGFNPIEITTMDYNLRSLIERHNFQQICALHLGLEKD